MMKTPQQQIKRAFAKQMCRCNEKYGDNPKCPKHGRPMLTKLVVVTDSERREFRSGRWEKS